MPADRNLSCTHARLSSWRCAHIAQCTYADQQPAQEAGRGASGTGGHAPGAGCQGHECGTPCQSSPGWTFVRAPQSATTLLNKKAGSLMAPHPLPWSVLESVLSPAQAEPTPRRCPTAAAVHALCSGCTLAEATPRRYPTAAAVHALCSGCALSPPQAEPTPRRCPTAAAVHALCSGCA